MRLHGFLGPACSVGSPCSFFKSRTPLLLSSNAVNLGLSSDDAISGQAGAERELLFFPSQQVIRIMKVFIQCPKTAEEGDHNLAFSCPT